MPTPSSGAISFTDIQTELGGANPIGIDEYYQNAAQSYTSGVSGIPNTGSAISLNMFYAKSKIVAAPVDYMTSGDVGGNMNESGGGRMGIDGVDDGFANIGSVAFPFFWFGTDWGSSNNIQWTTNNVLTFGGGSSQYSTWSATTARGVLMGQADRRTNFSTQFNVYTSNNHSIKKIIVSQANYYGTAGSEIQMEIRLIRGTTYQYIEIRMANWSASTGGLWNISDGGTFYNPFTSSPPVGTGQSVVLRGDLNGYNWQAFNNRYVNL